MRMRIVRARGSSVMFVIAAVRVRVTGLAADAGCLTVSWLIGDTSAWLAVQARRRSRVRVRSRTSRHRGAEAVVDVDDRHARRAARQHAEQRGQAAERGAVADDVGTAITGSRDQARRRRGLSTRPPCSAHTMMPGRAPARPRWLRMRCSPSYANVERCRAPAPRRCARSRSASAATGRSLVPAVMTSTGSLRERGASPSRVTSAVRDGSSIVQLRAPAAAARPTLSSASRRVTNTACPGG